MRRVGEAIGFRTGRCSGFIHYTGLFMSIIDYLATNQIMVGVACSSKKQLIEQLAERAAELTGLCQRSLFEIVMSRERLGQHRHWQRYCDSTCRASGFDAHFGHHCRLDKSGRF